MYTLSLSSNMHRQKLWPSGCYQLVGTVIRIQNISNKIKRDKAILDHAEVDNHQVQRSNLSKQ